MTDDMRDILTEHAGDALRLMEMLQRRSGVDLAPEIPVVLAQFEADTRTTISLALARAGMHSVASATARSTSTATLTEAFEDDVKRLGVVDRLSATVKALRADLRQSHDDLREQIDDHEATLNKICEALQIERAGNARWVFAQLEARLKSSGAGND